MSRGLDYSTGPPSAAAVRAAGYEFVVRYVSRPGNPKNITAPEFADLTGNGVAVALVFETTAERALSGYAGGAADARTAADQASGVGMPGDRPIYFAVDFDAQPNQLGVIDDYLRGAASVIGSRRVGVYGSQLVTRHCLDVGSTHFAWQSAAWRGGDGSAGPPDRRVHLFQRRDTVQVDGVSCVVNDSNATDFGQWPKGAGSVSKDNDATVTVAGSGPSGKDRPGEGVEATAVSGTAPPAPVAAAEPVLVELASANQAPANQPPATQAPAEPAARHGVLTDYAVSFLRTAVPSLWGAAVAYLVSLGVLPSGWSEQVETISTTVLVPVCISAVYAVARWLENRAWFPNWASRILLGSKRKPNYSS
ncbi:DUF1906 domain-containing protein [Goodfellowiella coeruleoviolacea]|uniref:Rv2525c-like glycoside hydrolase-like domain-containing protein n=1 Tax=Goodfellowiella coeruleoviolacea TaxID=334858 RepID=A0AAE3GFE5_9PSEU|nr:DUF1906 domain-containing protein [Goodfellowiella coeruleoviolacea]MCP2166713.1 protein of unknown function (DUF1906) [Goodfellowiella coeruleoviolacea]